MKAMLHLLRTHWRLVVLVLIVLLLLPAVVAALMAAEDAPEPAATPVEEVSEPAIEPAAQPPDAAPGGPAPFAEYQEMIERPLFSSTRRPPLLRDAPQENLDAQQLREAWRLSGIALHRGRQLASFSERQGERRLLLEQGMVLADEWRLEQIGSDHVLLGNGTSEVYLPLREPVVAEEPAPGETPAQKKQKKPKKQKQQGQPEQPSQPAAPTDQTTAPADTPAPAAPAQ